MPLVSGVPGIDNRCGQRLWAAPDAADDVTAAGVPPVASPAVHRVVPMLCMKIVE